MKRILFNPFEKYNEVTLIITGLISAIACSYIGYLCNARFDGVLDMHLVKNVTLIQPFTDNAINIVSLFLFLYISGIIINRKTRIIDIVNTVLIARILYCIIPLFNPDYLAPGVSDKLMEIDPKKPGLLNLSVWEMTSMGIIAIIMLGILVWYIALLYNGFKTATNAKSIKHIILFTVSIIFAEILSSYLIFLVN